MKRNEPRPAEPDSHPGSRARHAPSPVLGPVSLAVTNTREAGAPPTPNAEGKSEANCCQGGGLDSNSGLLAFKTRVPLRLALGHCWVTSPSSPSSLIRVTPHGPSKHGSGAPPTPARAVSPGQVSPARTISGGKEGNGPGEKTQSLRTTNLRGNQFAESVLNSRHWQGLRGQFGSISL